MAFCAVRGCGSNVNEYTDLTFHSLPKTLVPRARWVIALGPLPEGSYVCSRHFEPSMFTKRGILNRNAVPKRILDSSPNEPSPNLIECSDDTGSSEEVVACRVCLAVDGRLFAISGSGFEDALAALTGVPLPAEGNLPRHLCVFCLTKLSKYAAFRNGCQRSTALLEALLKRGPLNMNVIRAHSKKSQELMKNLSVKNVFQFGTTPVIEINPLVRTENNLYPHKESEIENTEYTEVEYLDGEDFIENNGMDVENFNFELPMAKRETSTIKSFVNEQPKHKNNVEAENPDSRPEICSCVESKVINDTCDDDMPVLEDTIATSKTGADLVFEKEFNFEITMLSKQEQKQMIEERKKNNTSAYVCNLCGKENIDESSLTRHKNYFHDPSLPVECGVCLHRFRSLRHLRTHQTEYRHRAVFTCNECGAVCRNRTNAKDHYRMHQGRTYTCPYCQKKYARQSSYYGHVRRQHPAHNEACDQCGETFTGKVGLLVHKRMHHRTKDKQKKDLKCKDCDVTFLSAEALQRHSELSAGVPHAALWACAACGDSCGSELALAAHAADKHPPKQHYCKECDKTFLNSASFELHWQRKHLARRSRPGPFPQTPPRPVTYVCELCGKLLKLTSPAQLQYHMNGHMDVKPFQCQHCPKSFAQQFALKMHLRVHTGERPYQCDQCPLAFALQCNLSRHINKIHLKQYKSVECYVCGKMYGAASISSHIRFVHMKQPYVRRKRDRKKRLATES